MSDITTAPLIPVQRCVRAKKKSGDAALPGYCNTLNTHPRRCVLDIEPLSQFDYPKAALPQIRKDIMQRYHGGDQNEMDWMWGKSVLLNAPRSARNFNRAGCGTVCLTMILRYLRIKGESETFYDKIVKGLKAEHRPALARRNAGSDDVSADWHNWNVPKYWYPVHVLWWMRQQYGISKSTGDVRGKWSWWNDYPMLTPNGVFWIEDWAQKARREAARARKTMLQAAQAQPPFDLTKRMVLIDLETRKIAESNVPRAMRELGLEMREWGTMPWTNAKARERVHGRIRKAIEDGYPTIVLLPGHFSLITGFVEAEERVRHGDKTSTRLTRRYVVNNPGEGRLQHTIDRDRPEAKYKWSMYFILRLTADKQVEKRTLNLHSKKLNSI